MKKISSWKSHFNTLFSLNYFWCWIAREGKNTFWLYTNPPQNGLYRGNEQNVRCFYGENIYSIGISRLKILNVLVSSTRYQYQKIYFCYLGLKKLGVCFLESKPSTSCNQRSMKQEGYKLYLPLLVLFCCQWLHHLPQMHWKKLEYFITLF